MGCTPDNQFRNGLLVLPEVLEPIPSQLRRRSGYWNSNRAAEAADVGRWVGRQALQALVLCLSQPWERVRSWCVTEFTETAMRHFCRNPKCRAKLKDPTSNSREAFCSLKPNGCRDRFYRLRCYVCEEKKTGRLEANTCGRRKCKNAMRRLKRTEDTTRVEIGIGNPIKPGLKTGLGTDRRWFIVAGEISPNALHCATVPDGPGGSWGSGSVERIEAQNRRALKAHFAELSEKAAVQRQHMPPNILGGYQHRLLKLGPEKTLDIIRDRVASGVPFDDPDAEQWKIPDPVIPGMGYDRLPVPKQEPHAGTIPDDLSIPAFLDRRVRR